MSNVSLNTMRSFSPSCGENTTMKTNSTLPPAYGDETYGWTPAGQAKWPALFDFNASGGNTNTATIG